MKPTNPSGYLPTAASEGGGQKPGAIVRAARLAAGLTLADLGRRCGYSASQISRYERGIQPLTDIILLRRFAEALAIAPQAFGLTLTGEGAGRHAGNPKAPCAHTCGPNVGPECPWEGDDPVRRRELLAGAAGLAGAAALGASRRDQPRPPADPAQGLENLLYGSTAAAPASLSVLDTAVGRARHDFQAARYDRLTVSLPGLIATASATRDHAGGQQRATASALLADAYITATNLMVKLNDDPLAWTTADRALLAAQAGDDPLTLADARRAVATVLRRTGRPARARDVLASAIEVIEPDRHPSPAQLATYGTLLQVAAYTAAVDGNRHSADELIGEAAAIAARIGTSTSPRFPTFGSAGVTLYQVSIAQVLGDNGTAIEHARKLRPVAIPTAERQGRYWIDVARAYHQWGKSESCYRALLAAERAAPAEVRYRPPVHRMAEDLLHADRRQSLPGLRSFAHRIGVPAS
jgi:transcriptional regulator with XRE-family HTH domain